MIWKYSTNNDLTKKAIIWSILKLMYLVLFFFDEQGEGLFGGWAIMYCMPQHVVSFMRHTISFIHQKSAHVMQENTKEKIMVNVKTFFRQYAWLGWEFEITPKRAQSVTIDMRTQHGIGEQFIIAFLCE